MNIPGLPELPVIDDETMESCHVSGDFRAAMFEWYRYVGMLAMSYASLKDAGALRLMQQRNYATLIALLARCSKLMRSVLILSADGGRRGESTSVLHRSIVESAVKLRWLCQPGTEERFDRFIVDGLKTELYLRKDIERRIAQRGHTLNIETRMLASIASTLAHSGVTEAAIQSTPKLPDYATMLRELGNDPLAYTVYQRIGSHAVHGTWVSLLVEYLETNEDGELALRDTIDTNLNLYLAAALSVLDALDAFARFITLNPRTIEALQEPLDIARENILAIRNASIGADYEPTA